MRWTMMAALMLAACDEGDATRTGDTSAGSDTGPVTWECPPAKGYRLVARICGESPPQEVDWPGMQHDLKHDGCRMIWDGSMWVLDFEGAAPGGEVTMRNWPPPDTGSVEGVPIGVWYLQPATDLVPEILIMDVNADADPLTKCGPQDARLLFVSRETIKLHD